MNLFFTKKKNTAIKILFIYNGIFFFAGSMLGPLYALYVSKFSIGVLPVSISWAVFSAATAIFTYILRWIGDRVKEKEYLLLAGYLLRAIAWFSFIFINSFSQLIIIQIIFGLGEALGAPAFDALFAEHLDKGKYIKEYADWRLLSNLVLALGTFIGGVIVVRFGFQVLFLVMSILAMIAFFGILMKPRKLL